MSRQEGCKVEVVVNRYDLQPAGDRYGSLDEYLLTRWTGDDGRDPVGYRTLANEFNRRLLKRLYDRHGREVLGARLESEYETLTGEDDLERAELVDYLADDGVDAERVRRDMVSRGTIATHLKDCLDGEKTPHEAATNWERRSIDIATDHAREKVEEAVSSLASKGALPADRTAEVTLHVQLGCPACQTRVPLTIALERGYVCEAHR